MLNSFAMFIDHQVVPQAGRKAAKGKGLDREAIRAGKEEKNIQIRKEKRLDRANIERRKVGIVVDTLLTSTSSC